MPTATSTPSTRQDPPAKETSGRVSPYRRPFDGQKRFFSAIKLGHDGLPPAYSASIGSIGFSRFTQRPFPLEDDSGQWLATGNNEPGGFVDLNYEQLQAALEQAPYLVVRWSGRSEKKESKFRRADILDTRMGRFITAQTPGFPPIWNPGVYQKSPTDEPLIKYLVLLPAAELEQHGGRYELEKMPSMLELDPSLEKVPTTTSA